MVCPAADLCTHKVAEMWEAAVCIVVHWRSGHCVSLPLKHGSNCVVLAVVFGKVVEGMALVRKAEATGTQSGKPRQPVLIADSGEVCIEHIHPSRH